MPGTGYFPEEPTPKLGYRTIEFYATYAALLVAALVAVAIVTADDATGLETARVDGEAVHRMVFTGSDFPSRWCGEHGSNRAEARAMQAPAERHWRRERRRF